jgi:uncharacterized protein YlxW (UPF0749 family)
MGVLMEVVEMCMPRDLPQRVAVATLMAVASVCAGAETKDTSGAEVQNTGYLTVVMDVERLRVAKERLKAGDKSLEPALKALRAEAKAQRANLLWP